jgi:tetratricopeptide (TPR) repeat protein
MRQGAIVAITVVVCALTAQAQATDNSSQHQVEGIEEFRQGKYAEAEQKFRKTLEDTRARGGTALPAYAGALVNLAATLLLQGRLGEARALFEQCVRLKYEPDPGDQARAHALNGLALIYQTDGSLTQAARLLDRALSFPNLDEETRAGTLHNSGVMQFELGRWSKAGKFFAQAREIYERIGDQTNLPSTLMYEARIAASQKRTGSAGEYMQRALAMRRAQSGPLDPHFATTLGDAGEVQRQMGQYGAAVKSFEEAMHILEQSLGPGHAASAGPLYYFAETRRDQGRHEEALALYEQCISIFERHFGPNHGRLAYVYQGAAEASAKLKLKKEAKSYKQRADAIFSRSVDYGKHTVDVSSFASRK